MAGSIVCGVEDSVGAHRPVAIAVELADDLSKRLLLVHVNSGDPSFPYGDGARRERRRHAAWQRGHTLVSEMRRRWPGRIEMHEGLRTGDPAAELARVAGDDQADLVVVGCRGRGEISSAVLGSVSQSLERLSPCPVVVVPPGAPAAKAEPPEKDDTVVCGVADPETQAGLVEFSAGLAGALCARLDVVHAAEWNGRDDAVPAPTSADFWSSGRDAEGDLGLLRLQTAMYLAEAHGVRADARLVAGPPALALGRVAERDGGRLIVIGSRRSGRLRALLRGSVSRQLAKFGRTPVLIVPEDGRDGSRDGRPAARHAML